MYKRRFYKKDKKLKRDVKLLSISLFDESTLCVKNTYEMYNENLKNIYKKYGGVWSPEVKHWLINIENEKEMIKDIKALYKKNAITVNRVPRFVNNILNSKTINEKKMIIFKGKIIKYFN